MSDWFLEKLPFKQLVRRIVAHAKLEVYELDLTKIHVCDVKIRVNVRLLSANDINVMLWGEVEAKMKLSMRFIKDHLCFVAQQNGMIIGYAWVAFGEIYVSEIERTMKLQADEAEIYDVFVSREHRGKRVAHEMLRNICDYLREKGMRKACIAALSTNGASRRMIERMGFTKNGTVTFFKLFWMRKYSEDWRSSELATELV